MPAPASDRARTALRIALWLALGGWIGALLLCGGVVVPAAFGSGIDPAAAGNLVGRVLGRLHVAGIVLGLTLAALGGALGRGRFAAGLAIALAACSAVNHFVVSPAVAAIDLTDPAAGAAGAGARFASLHRLSVALFLSVAVGTLGLAALHAAQELREDRPGRP